MVTIAFGPGNTFWTKVENSAATNQPLQYFGYNVGAGTATLIQNYLNIPGGPLHFDVSRNLLGIVRGIGHEFRLFRLTANGFVPQGGTVLFPGTNSNGNLTGAVAFGPDKAFALESNNGLMAFSISTNTLPPFSVHLTRPGAVGRSWAAPLTERELTFRWWIALQVRDSIASERIDSPADVHTPMSTSLIELFCC